MDSWIGSYGKGGTDSSGITSPLPASRIIGSFVLKFSPSVFAISLTRSNPRLNNALWELFLVMKESEDDVEVYCCLDLHGAQRRGYSIRMFVTCS